MQSGGDDAPVALGRAIGLAAVVAVVGIAPAEHERTDAMRVLRKELQAAVKVIGLHFRRMAALHLVEPLFHDAHVGEPGRHIRHVRVLGRVFTAGGIAPLIGQHGQMIALIERVDHAVPVLHVAGLPGAEVLIHAHI